MTNEEIKARERRVKQAKEEASKTMLDRILKEMPEEKKMQLRKQIERNGEFTSDYRFTRATVTTYTEGWYITIEGTRAGFSIFAGDNDGELVFGRKPRTLTFLFKAELDNLNIA